MKSHDILSQIDHRTGMTVPDDYFAQFNRQMADMIPKQEWEKEEPVVMPRTFWQKVRPYVYMAAMFAGIWCMMKTFDLMRVDTGGSVEKNPQLVSAVNNDAFFNDYCTPVMSETDVIDQLYEEGFDPESLDDSI